MISEGDNLSWMMKLIGKVIAIALPYPLGTKGLAKHEGGNAQVLTIEVDLG